MSAARPIGVGVIGLGFMGRTHLRAYEAAAKDGFPCRLVAVCDVLAEAREHAAREAGAAHAVTHADPGALLEDGGVDLVSICTPTETHVALGLAALGAGKHALIEKPVALTADAVRPLAEAAARSPALCMPAMCVRHWPGWDWLLARVRDGSLGAVRSAVFQRLGARPAWGEGFYTDHSRSGGALIDFHIHDADLVLRLFGPPVSVSCAGSLEHVTTQYRFARGPAHVTAEAGWTLAPGAPFRMRYLVSFERATAEFELGRRPALRVYTEAGAPARDIALSPTTGYDEQVRAALRDVLRREGRSDSVPPAGADAPLTTPTLAEALEVAALLDAERASLERGETVRLR